MFRQASQRAFRRFCGESGSVTVEAALWLPFFVILLTLIADVALIFHGQARALDVAQKANRALSTGELKSTSETEEYILLTMSQISPNAVAVTAVNRGLITTTLTLPAGDLDAVGFFTGLSSFNMQVTSQQVMEN